VQQLVQSFVAAGDWSDARVTTFNSALAELGGAQIGAAAHEGWFRQFVDELRRRLKEQQALSPTRLTVDNTPLAALAVTVGIDLDSPDSALHIAPLPPPRPAESVQGAAAARPAQQPRVAATAAAGAAAPNGEVAHGPGAGSNVAAARTDTTTASSVATHDAATTPGAALSSSPAAAARGQDAHNAAHAAATPAFGAAGDVHTGANAQPAVQADSHSDSGASADACRAELARSRRPLCHDVIPGGAAGPEMAVVPAGAFDMGSTAASEEQPVHHVTIGQAFAVSVYEVSQGELKQFCDATHRACAQQPWSGEDYPAVNVSWDDARAYTDWLTSVTHHHYSLPTEAQWEYAARAGSTGLYPNGDSTLSPTDADYSVSKLQTVAARRSERFNANAFRLMHTLGNVREWVQDAWVQNYKGAPDDGTAVRSTQAAMRVARGGSYADGASRLRLSLREGLVPGTRDVRTGFRIVRELP
jgi:formylglycine-generating enzyme required for sulfatase activity